MYKYYSSSLVARYRIYLVAGYICFYCPLVEAWFKWGILNSFHIGFGMQWTVDFQRSFYLVCQEPVFYK